MYNIERKEQESQNTQSNSKAVSKFRVNKYFENGILALHQTAHEDQIVLGIKIKCSIK